MSELGAFDGWQRAPAFVQRAARALVEIDDTIDPAEPLRFASRRAASRVDPSRSAITSLLDFLGNRMPGRARSETRYRWELSHRIGVAMPRYAASERKARFHAHFGAEVVAVVPRVVVSHGTGAELRALRQRLGREITELKQLASTPETGVLVASNG